MSGLADYAGYCLLSGDITFTQDAKPNDILELATIKIGYQGVIWALYPSDPDVWDSSEPFGITTRANPSDPPNGAVRLASMSVTNKIGSSVLSIQYDLSSIQPGDVYFFNAYLWGSLAAMKQKSVALTAQVNSDMTINVNGSTFNATGLEYVNVTWIANPPATGSSSSSRSK